MDYEKAYKEALFTMRQRMDAGIIERCYAEAIFPELHESEDERVRKALIQYLKDYPCNLPNGSYSRDDFFTYLEKQKEQKPEHLELKAGKWYICHRAFCCRADHLTVKEGERFMCEKNGVVKGFIIKEPEKYFKECSAPAPMEEEQKEQKPISSCDIVPYIDDKIAALQDMWREEKVAFDWDDMHEMIEDVARHFYQKEPKQEWDDYTKTNLGRAIQIIKNAKGNLQGYQTDDGIYECDKAIECLEHFLYRGLEIEKPTEWSGVDNLRLHQTIDVCDRNGYPVLSKWLKGLLGRITPQSSWKPSEEQMEALRIVLEHEAERIGSSEELSLANSLYEQLKALM